MSMMVREPSFKELMEDVWSAKVYVLTGAVCAVLAVFVFLAFATPRYQAKMIIAPADGYALGDYASAVSTERVANLPFWRPSDPEGVSTDYYRFIHTLRGPSVADILMKDKSVVDGIDPGEEWTREKLADYLDRRIKIEPLGATPLRQIAYQHPDQEFASMLLRKVNFVADQLIRRDRRRQSQNRVEYLETSLNTTRNPDHRKIITNLLMQQEHIQMLANLDEPYAAIVVEPAATGPKPYWPKPALFYPAGLLLGGFIGFLIWSMTGARRYG